MEKELIRILQQRIEDTLFQLFCEIAQENDIEFNCIRKEDPFIRKIINESLSYVIFEMDLEEAVVESILGMENLKC